MMKIELTKDEFIEILSCLSHCSVHNHQELDDRSLYVKLCKIFKENDDED